MARLLRRASAQSRQWVWKATISSLLILPLLCLLLPTWRLPIPLEIPLETAPVLAPPSESVVQFSTPETIPPVSETVSSVPVIAEIPAPDIAPPPPDSAPILLPSMSDAPKPTYPIVLGIYLCGLGLVVLRALIAFIRLHFLARRAAVCTDAHILDSGQEAARKLGRTSSVQLLIAASNSRERVPMTWGFWRPCVLLPFDAPNWEASRTHAVLLHEFAHIARADWLMQQIATVTSALYWFHPLVWRAARSLKLESERACDECVIAAGISPTDYATVLLETTRAHKQRIFSPEGAISMANPAHLSVRIQSILDSRISRRTPSRSLIFCVSILSLAGIMALSALRPADAELSLSAEINAPPERAEAELSVSPVTVAVLPPPATTDTEFKGKIVWGEVKDGLQTGLRFASKKRTYTKNDTLPVQYFLRNFGKKTRRLKVVVPSFVRLYGISTKIFNNKFVKGDFRWTGSEGEVSRIQLVLSPNAVVPLALNIEPAYLNMWSEGTIPPNISSDSKRLSQKLQTESPSPGLYKTRWEARIEYRDANKPNSQRLKMPLPGSLSVMIAAAPSLVPVDATPIYEDKKAVALLKQTEPEVKSLRLLAANVQKPLSAPSAKPETIFTGEIAWGEARDGLQTGLRLSSGKKIYTKADLLPVQYVLRNVGKNTRRLKLLVPSSVYLNGVSQKIFSESESVEGDLRWRGREEELSRIEVILPPGRVVPLSLEIEPVHLSRYGERFLRPGIFMTRWDVPIEYRNAESPEMSRLKMPRPGSVSVMIAASPKTAANQKNASREISYGMAVNGIQLGVSRPVSERTTPGRCRSAWSRRHCSMPSEFFRRRTKFM